jgi:hypothetical protein
MSRRVGGQREVLVRLLERLCCLGHSLGCRPLFGGQWDRDRLTQFMLPREEVRGVMHPQVGGNIGQKLWGFLAGRWHHPTIKTRKGRFHQSMPSVVIPCRGHLFQHNGVAHRFYPCQAQTTRKRFILGQRDGFVWPLVRQPYACCVAVRHKGLLHTPVDLVLRPIRGDDKAIEARELQEQTYKAHPTRPHLDIHQVDRQDRSMQEGETGAVTEACCPIRKSA